MPHFVLFKEERQQHQHPSVVDDPPHVDVAVCKAFVVARVEGYIFWDHQSQMGSGRAADGVLVKKQTVWILDHFPQSFTKIK